MVQKVCHDVIVSSVDKSTQSTHQCESEYYEKNHFEEAMNSLETIMTTENRRRRIKWSNWVDDDDDEVNDKLHSKAL